MSLAFKTTLPSTPKLVLLALCDSANDQGECYPSIPTLMEKSSLSERAVQGAIQALEATGYLRREFRSGRSTVYWMTPAAGAPPQQVPPARSAPTPAPHAPPPPQDVHPTPAAGAPITIKEPSIEPSRKQRKARERAADLECPDGVAAGVWADWLKLRKAKRAPVTATVLEGVESEAAKAGLTLEEFLRVWCRRGTQGLEADWLKPNERGKRAPPATEPAWRSENRQRTQAFAGRYAAKPMTTEVETIDAAPPLLD